MRMNANEWFSRWMVLLWSSVLCCVCLQLPKVKDVGRGKGRGKGRASHPMICSKPRDVEAYRSFECGIALQQGHAMTCLFWCVPNLNWTAGLEIQRVRTKSTKVFGSMLSSWRRWRHLCRASNIHSYSFIIRYLYIYGGGDHIYIYIYVPKACHSFFVFVSLFLLFFLLLFLLYVASFFFLFHWQIGPAFVFFLFFFFFFFFLLFLLLLLFFFFLFLFVFLPSCRHFPGVVVVSVSSSYYYLFSSFCLFFCCSFCSYSLCSNARVRFALLQMPLSSPFARNPAIRFSSFFHLLTVPGLASCIYPSTMAVQFCFWQWNSRGLKRITTHSHSIVAWLFNSASGNGTVMGLCSWGTFRDSAAQPAPICNP